MTREEAIEKFRAIEDVESVLVLVGREPIQANLRAVALAWPKVRVRYTGPNKFRDAPDLWDALWDATIIDIPQIAVISNTRKDCDRYITMLKGYRLIYPDGTLSTVAQRALRTLAKAVLGL